MSEAPLWVDSASALDDLLDILVAEPRYGLDTEFHRERTYFPRLALVQLSWADRVAVVDPLAVDIAPLARLLDGDGLAILHAAEQDLEVLRRACGTIPKRMFDTQVACAFVGLGYASLARLVQAVTRKRIPKGDRLTDWTRRPLEDAQVRYAAADVEHLLAAVDYLSKKAEKAGTLEWIHEECERIRTRRTGVTEPDTAWWKIKGSRSLRNQSRVVAQQVAAWRERRAARKDVPPRYILPDLALAGIVQKPPKAREDLRNVRGLEPRYLKGGVEGEIWKAVERGRAMDPDDLKVPPSGDPPDENLGPYVALGLALVAQIAAERKIEPTMLAARADVLAIAAGRKTGRLSKGWRSELAGRAIRALFAGEAALAGDGKGGVRLVELGSDGNPS